MQDWSSNKNELSKLISSEQEFDGFEEPEVSDIYNVNFLTEEQAQKLTSELNNVTDNEIKEIFDFKIVNETDIYGNPLDEKSILYFVKHFQKLKSFRFLWSFVLIAGSIQLSNQFTADYYMIIAGFLNLVFVKLR